MGRRGARPGCWVLPSRPGPAPPAAWGYLSRHVHEQHGGRRLGLAVAPLGSVKV